MLAIVNTLSDEELSQKLAIDNIDKFTDLISTPKSLQIQENIYKIGNDNMNNFTVTMNEEIQTLNVNSQGRVKSFTAVKNTIANMESEFVLFKEEVSKSFAEIQAMLNEKDQKIELLNNRIAFLEAVNDLVEKQQNIKKQIQFEKKR